MPIFPGISNCQASSLVEPFARDFLNLSMRTPLRPILASVSFFTAACLQPVLADITTPAVHTAAIHIDVRLVGIMTVLPAEG